MIEQLIERYEHRLTVLERRLDDENESSSHERIKANIISYTEFLTDLRRMEILLPSSIAVNALKFRLEVNAGRLAEPLLKRKVDPKIDPECYEAFLVLSHIDQIEEYLKNIGEVPMETPTKEK